MIQLTNEDHTRTEWLIEANSFEQLVLWQRWSAENKATNLIWEQDSRGSIQTIGKLDKRPVAVCIFWYQIEGIIVGFYEATSIVVDHDMVRAWLKKTYPKAQFTNSYNFHHCAHGISDKTKKKIEFYKDLA